MDGLEGADAAEAVDVALPGTTEDADEAAEAAGAEAVSEDELLESSDEEDDVQARNLERGWRREYALAWVELNVC
jgi:hypothetical protein